MLESLVGQSGITVSVENSSDTVVVDPDRWGAIAVATLGGEGIGQGHLDLAFVSVETMTQINEEHMGATGPTDVLAFPMDAPQLAVGASVDADLAGLPVHLGDIVICPDKASAQAIDHVGSVEGEFCLLTIHAALHLLGHDHVTDDERLTMQARERFYLAEFGFEHPVGVSGQ